MWQTRDKTIRLGFDCNQLTNNTHSPTHTHTYRHSHLAGACSSLTFCRCVACAWSRRRCPVGSSRGRSSLWSPWWMGCATSWRLFFPLLYSPLLSTALHSSLLLALPLVVFLTVFCWFFLLASASICNCFWFIVSPAAAGSLSLSFSLSLVHVLASLFCLHAFFIFDLFAFPNCFRLVYCTLFSRISKLIEKLQVEIYLLNLFANSFQDRTFLCSFLWCFFIHSFHFDSHFE